MGGFTCFVNPPPHHLPLFSSLSTSSFFFSPDFSPSAMAWTGEVEQLGPSDFYGFTGVTEGLVYHGWRTLARLTTRRLCRSPPPPTDQLTPIASLSVLNRKCSRDFSEPAHGAFEVSR